MTMMNKFTWVYSLGNLCIGRESYLEHPEASSLPQYAYGYQYGCSSGSRTTSRPLTSS